MERRSPSGANAHLEILMNDRRTFLKHLLCMLMLVVPSMSVSPAFAQFWSVDFRRTGTPVTMNGVAPIYGFGNVWNNFRLAHVPDVSNTASANLVNSTGGAFDAFLIVERQGLGRQWGRRRRA